MLDIETPRGQDSAKHERRAAEIFEKNTGLVYAGTNKRAPASVDAVLLRDKQIIGLAETKCRYMSNHKFSNDYQSKWLVTFQKILDCAAAARYMQCAFFGFLYLVEDDLLLVQKLAGPDGDLLCNLQITTSATQKTINGGTAVRTNAYIDMSGAKVFS